MKLTAAGKTLFVMLTVKMDPRVKTSAADLSRQFALAMELAAESGQASAASQQADDLLKQVAARRKEAEGKVDLASALANLEKETTAVAGAATGGGGFGGFGLAAPDDQPKTLREAAAALGGLLGVVESADVGPTTDAAAASAKWEAAAKAAMGRWEQLRTKELARVNSLIEAAHLQALKIAEPAPR